MLRSLRFSIGIILCTLLGPAALNARAATFTAPALIVSCNATNNQQPETVLRYQASNGQFVDQFASLTTPAGIAEAPDGSVCVCSPNTNSVLRYNRTTGALLSQFTAPEAYDIAFGPDQMAYVDDSDVVGEVLKFNAITGQSEGVFASGNGMALSLTLAFGPDGNLYVGSNGINNAPKQVLEFSGSTGQFIKTFTANPELKWVAGLAFGPNGDLFVSDSISDTVWRFNGATGAPDGSIIGGHLNNPDDITFGPDNNLYVAGGGSNDVEEFNGLTGNFITTFASGNGLDGPISLAFVPEPCTGLLAGGTIFLIASRRSGRRDSQI